MMCKCIFVPPDIDECANESRCVDNAQCNNLPGTYNCTCKNGFSGNGSVSCEGKVRLSLNTLYLSFKSTVTVGWHRTWVEVYPLNHSHQIVFSSSSFAFSHHVIIIMTKCFSLIFFICTLFYWGFFSMSNLFWHFFSTVPNPQEGSYALLCKEQWRLETWV